MLLALGPARPSAFPRPASWTPPPFRSENIPVVTARFQKKNGCLRPDSLHVLSLLGENYFSKQIKLRRPFVKKGPSKAASGIFFCPSGGPLAELHMHWPLLRKPLGGSGGRNENRQRPSPSPTPLLDFFRLFSIPTTHNDDPSLSHISPLFRKG